MRHMGCRALLTLVAVMIVGCGDDNSGDETKPPRPVTVIILKETDPSVKLDLTGSAKPWQEQDIGFEVTGRIEYVVEEETEIEGKTFDERNRPLTKGTVLATLDKTRYEMVLKKAEAEADSAAARATALQIQIDKVLPAQIRAAQAELKLAKSELTKLVTAHKVNAATDVEVESQEARAESAAAAVDKLEADVEGAKAERLGAEAVVAQSAQSVQQAKLDLADCTLRSPFTGRISLRHVTVGGVVQVGEPVVRVTAMDPIEINLAVSSATDRGINVGDKLEVYPPGIDEPTTGFVYEKSSVADPKLRTFQIKLMVRNMRVPAIRADIKVVAEMVSREHFLKFLLASPEGKALHADKTTSALLARITPGKALSRELLEELAANSSVRHVFSKHIGMDTLRLIQTRDAVATKPLFVDTRALITEAGGKSYVWKVSQPKTTTSAPDAPADQTIITLTKVYVRPGDQRHVVSTKMILREIEELAGEDGEQLARHTAVAMDVPSWVRDGDTMLRRRMRWLFRPNDLARVRLVSPGPGKGLYAPMQTIGTEADGRHFVYVVQPDKIGQLQAKKLAVTVTGQLGDKRSIVGEGLAPGAKIILRGASTVIDGEPVRVVGEESAR